MAKSCTVPKVGGAAAGGLVGYVGGRALSAKLYPPIYYLGIQDAPEFLKGVFGWNVLRGTAGAISGYFVGKKVGKCNR
jgi:hypothetical protein